MDGKVICKMVAWEFCVGNDVRSGKVSPIHNSQAAVCVFGNHNRYPLGVEEDPGNLAVGVVALSDGLGHLLLGQGSTTPGMGRDEDRDVSLVKAGPVYHGFHVEGPLIAIERCYGAQAILEGDLGAAHQPGVEQVKILRCLGSSTYPVQKST